MNAEPTLVSKPLRIFRFADLELDEGQQRVLRGGRELPLPKLSFDLLLVLAESAPNYVSNKELMARVWPGLVIADKTVSQRVKLLRDALGDDHEEPRYVAGLRSRGYRIAAPVSCLDQELAGNVVHHALSDARGLARSRTTHKAFWLLPVIGVLALSGIAWWQLGDSPNPPHASAIGESMEARVTVAVLPFRVLDSNEADAYIALGVPERVLDQLSTVEGLAVIARSSSFKIDQTDSDVRETGTRLGAGYLIDGSVQRNGDMLRVSAQLLDAESGTQIWAERFDRPISKIFEIQDQIASSVAAALRVRIAELEPLETQRRQTQNIDAYLAYLRGRSMLARWTVIDADAATSAFEEAIELDPGFAAAYASLYDSRMMAMDRRSGGPTPKRMRSAMRNDESEYVRTRTRNRSLIEKALALDPACGAAYFARAIWEDDDTVTREADFQRGLQLDPSNGRGITAYAEFLDRSGRGDEAAAFLRRAIRIDPLSPRAYFWRVMRAFPSDPETLEAGMLHVLEIDPAYLPALQRYAKYQWMMHGELAQAIRMIEHAIALDPANPWLVHTAVAMYLDIGDPAEAQALVDNSERPDVSGRLLILLYASDVQGAGEAAYDDSAFANGLYEIWGVYESVVGWSEMNGDYTQALAYLGQRSGLEESNAAVTVENFRAVPAYARVQMAAGNADDARELLTKCIQWIDEYHVPQLSKVYALRVKANAQMLLGQTDLALQTLRESFDAQDYLQWWYTLERDSLWMPLHDDPRFVAISNRVKEHVARQKQQLQSLRRDGLVPDRAHSLAAVDGHGQ